MSAAGLIEAARKPDGAQRPQRALREAQRLSATMGAATGPEALAEQLGRT